MSEHMRFSLRHWLSIPLVGALTWLLHEAAHWSAGVVLGYEMWISLNKVGLVSGTYDPAWHGDVVTAAGPIFTCMQAVVALWVLMRIKSPVAYAFLYFAAFMRGVAFLVSFRHPNDEARLSIDYGLPMWALPTAVVAVLAGMTVVGSRMLGVGWRQNLALYGVASAVAAAFVLGDQALRGGF